MPSDVNDEAAKLHTLAATQRVDQLPMPEVPKDVPQHFLLPTQGDPELWVVHVKVHCTFWARIQHLTHCSMASRTRSFLRSCTAASPKTTIRLLDLLSCWCLPILGFLDVSSSKVDHATSLLRFQTIYFAHLTQTIIGTATFLYLDPFIRR